MVEKNSSLKDFVVLQKLGEGSFSQVFKVKRLIDNTEYALKKVKLSSLDHKEKESALNEIRILASIQSQFIISYKDAFLDESSNTLCIVMEIANDGDLLNKINKAKKMAQQITENDIWKAFKDMTLGLKVLHDMKIFHRDLKGANVFIGKDQTYKLGDLNVSKVAKNDFVRTQTGTPYYCCPEIWNDQPYDNKCDIWSLGCILYEMAALKPPFQANDMKGLVAKVKRGVYESIPKIYSADLSLIIGEMLKVNPKQRPNTQQLLQNPIVMRRFNQDINTVHPKLPSQFELLNTIKLPSNLLQLKANLPKAKYNTDKVNVSVDKISQKIETQINPIERLSSAHPMNRAPLIQNPPKTPQNSGKINRTPSVGAINNNNLLYAPQNYKNQPQQAQIGNRNAPQQSVNQHKVIQNKIPQQQLPPKSNEVPRVQSSKPPVNPTVLKATPPTQPSQQNQQVKPSGNSRQNSREKISQNQPQKFIEHLKNNSRPTSGKQQPSKVISNPTKQLSVEKVYHYYFKNVKSNSRQNSAQKR